MPSCVGCNSVLEDGIDSGRDGGGTESAWGNSGRDGGRNSARPGFFPGRRQDDVLPRENPHFVGDSKRACPPHAKVSGVEIH